MSKLITENDLNGIFDAILPFDDRKAWVAFQKGGYTANNTASKVTGVTLSSGANATSYFTIGTDQVTVKQSGFYKISLSFCLSAITTESNCKRIALYKNGSENCVAIGRKPSWENCTNIAVTTLAKDDVLTMYARAEDGNSTFTASMILIEYLG